MPTYLENGLMKAEDRPVYSVITYCDFGNEVRVHCRNTTLIIASEILRDLQYPENVKLVISF